MDHAIALQKSTSSDNSHDDRRFSSAAIIGHKDLRTTQRYIDYDTECQRRVVNLV